MNGFLMMFKEALASKKFVAALAGALAAAALRIGLKLPTEDVVTILSPLVAYVIAQGFADRGKGAAKVEAVAVALADESASGGTITTKEKIETIKTA